jgi:hypothetical protein
LDWKFKEGYLSRPRSIAFLEGRRQNAQGRKQKEKAMGRQKGWRLEA